MRKLLSGLILVVFILSLAVSFSACSKSNHAEKFAGTWEELLNPSRTATITQNDKGFTWKDPEGEYPGELKNGVLLVNAGNFTVSVTYNAKDDTLTAEYDNTRTSYKRQK